VLRDSFVYCAEASRFQIVNVARPREPRLVGSCNAGDLTRAGLVVQDTLAYFTGPFVGMQVFSVANPASPYLVNTVADIRAAGVDIVDTLLYVGDYDDSLHIWSFASPRAPVQLSSLHLTRCGYGTVVLGRYAYVASDARIRVVDVGDPLNPVQVDSGRTPYEISRVVAAGSKVYVCCWDAGVCIFDTTQVGIADDRQEGPRVAVAYEARPNPTRRYVCLGMDGCRPVRAAVFDASGRAVAGLTVRHNGKVVLDMAGLVPGLYFVELESSEQQRNVVKVLKQ
ncbi:T9SS type A sorting domain-containing protein, partial [candidate division WOR-3 bacterium]|nr:T9SS type A sorting domain-containing protein [candidate division WOR-3 bacterium]